MFFRPKSSIDEDDRAWQFECWQWLLSNLGGIEALKEFKTTIPSKTDFPQSGKSGKAHAEHVFSQVTNYFGMDSGLFTLEEQETDIDPILAPLAVVSNSPVSPLGTYSLKDSTNHAVSYSPSSLKNLETLIATFAHEICHPILLTIPTPPPGEPEAEEFATDLAMVFFGFGIFGGNESFQFEQFTDSGTGTQGWSAKRAGYLNQNEWGFALAVRSHLTGENLEGFSKYCTRGLLLNYQQNYKFLEKNSSYLAPLREI